MSQYQADNQSLHAAGEWVGSVVLGYQVGLHETTAARGQFVEPYLIPRNLKLI
jgi:hypothetical protein